MKPLWSRSSFRKDFQNKTNHQTIWRISAPMILSNMTVPLVGMVDSAVMGHLDTSVYLAAVGLGSALFTFIIWTMGFLRMITTGLVAQAYGRSDYADVRQWLYMPLMMALLISFFVLLINPWLIDLILWWMEASDQVETKVVEYWNIRIVGLPLSLMNAVIVGWFLGVQNARYPLYILLIINLVNIVLDIVLVQAGMTVDGVAYASVIADAVGFVFAIVAVRYQLLSFNINDKFVLAWSKLIVLLNLNKDLLLRTLALELVMFSLHSRSSQLGDDAMAVNSIMLNILLLIANGLDGIANSIEALVGKAIGERSLSKFRAAVTIGGFWSLLLSVFLSIVLWFFADIIIALMTNIDVLKIELDSYLWVIALMPIVSVASFWIDGVFIGASAVKTMRNSMVLAVIFGFLPLYFLLQPWAVVGLWSAYFGFMICRATVGYFFFNQDYYQGRYISLTK